MTHEEKLREMVAEYDTWAIFGRKVTDDDKVACAAMIAGADALVELGAMRTAATIAEQQVFRGGRISAESPNLFNDLFNNEMARLERLEDTIVKKALRGDYEFK